MLSLTYEDGEHILLTVIEPSADGSFEYIYEFDGLTAKEENISFCNKLNMTSTKPYDIAYMSDVQRMIINGVNSADSTGEVLELLQNNAPAIGVSNVSEADLLNIADTLIEQRPFSEYRSYRNHNAYTNGFEKLNSSSWSSLSATIYEYKDLILFDNPDYAYYSNLSEKQKYYK